jgi:hypothetical protein
MSSNGNWPWQEMIAEFRALGGTIENVRLGTGPRGRGLFSIDNTEPVLLRLPENLLFSTDDIEFAGDHVRLKETAFVGRAEREFFDKYQENFSWGAGGRAKWVAFETALDALPAEIRTLLVAEFGMARRLEGGAIERARRQFLRSRQIGWKDRGVIMPLIELANNGEEGLRYQVGADLGIEGMVSDEVLVSHGTQDAWSLLFDYGYAGPAMGAFSLSMKMNVRPNELNIGCDTDRSVRRGNYLVPELAREGSRIVLSHLMLGLRPYPSAPRGIFRSLLNDSLGEKTDEVFDAVRHFNRTKLLQLLAALDPHEGPMIAEMRKMALLQLDAISWSIGSADLNAPVPPPWEATEAPRRAHAADRFAWTWDWTIDAFRNLGGVAENIRLAYGPSGRGIFPVDREKPFHLRVPSNLLFPASDITFVGDQIAIRPEAAIGTPEREFFEQYAEAFTWGGGGQSESAAFIAGLDSLPAEVRELMAQFGLPDLLEGDAEERTRKHFLRRRMIVWNGRPVLAPIAELINHRPDAVPYGGASFLEIEGRAGDEIFVSYRPADAFDCFRRFGFASPEPGAFCLGMKTKIGQFELVIKRDVGHAAHDAVITPQVERDRDRLVLSFLLLGHPGFPRMPRGTFRALMRRADFTNGEADEAFDRILRFNRLRFVKLLEALAPHDGKLLATLRKMARLQLEAMSWCIGAREI